jgi:hypothetical protein
MFDIYGIHKENRTYKDIKICFFHITDIVKTIWKQVWRYDLFELHKLKSEIAADKKLTSRKRKKTEDLLLPPCDVKIQRTNFCLSQGYPFPI